MMEQLPPFPLDMMATYRICVIGSLESDYVKRFWGMTSSPVTQAGEPEQTVLTGEVADQAALIGIINTLYNMGYTVVSVERMLPDTDLHLDDTNNDR